MQCFEFLYLVELGLNGSPIPVLRVLDQEHHKERNDGRAGVDDQLPRLRKLEKWSRIGPDDDSGDAKNKRRSGYRFARAVAVANFANMRSMEDFLLIKLEIGLQTWGDAI